jgi:putative transposase
MLVIYPFARKVIILRMLKAYRYRLYPDGDQTVWITKQIGSCRFAFNHALEVKEFAFLLEGSAVSSFELINPLKELKFIFHWIYEVDSQTLQQSVINLCSGYTPFFNGHAELPKFKNKYTIQSFRNPHGEKIAGCALVKKLGELPGT